METITKPAKRTKSYRLPASLIDAYEYLAIRENRLTCKVVEDVLTDHLRRVECETRPSPVLS